MGLVLRKTFDWQEDLESYDYDYFFNKSYSHSGRRMVILKLSWKGKLRKLFRIKK